MMTEEQMGVLRDNMSAIADIALACDANVGNCDDIEERAKIVHDHAARIALAALALCPPERLADVAAIFDEAIKTPMPKPGTPDEHAAKPPMAMPLALTSGHDGVEEAASVVPAKKRKVNSVTTPSAVVARAVTSTRKIYAEADLKADRDYNPYFLANVYEMDADDERKEICRVDFNPDVGSCRVTRILRGIVAGLRCYYQHKSNNKANRAAKMEAADA